MKLRRYGWYISIGVVCGVMLSFSRVNPYMGQITLHDLVFQLPGAVADDDRGDGGSGADGGAEKGYFGVQP